MSDRIVYQVITEPGGVDGLVVAAYYDKSEAILHKGHDCRLRVEPVVVDVSVIRAEVMRGLTPVQKLAVFGPDEKKLKR